MGSSDIAIGSDLGSRNQNAERLARLVGELNYAIARTEQEHLAQWASATGKNFLQFGWNRLTRTGSLAKLGVAGVYKEGQDFFRAWREERLMGHVQNRYSAFSVGTVNAYLATKETFSVLGRQLAESPRQAGARILTMVLASVIVSGGSDADGGAPDLDLMFGIGAHRSIFSHSIIMGTLLETGIAATFQLIEVIYKNLPPEHDVFWDAAIEQMDSIIEHARIGSSIGMAYHLLIDGTAQAAAYKDLPISLPIEAHQSILVANAAMEAVNAKAIANTVTGTSSPIALPSRPVMATTCTAGNTATEEISHDVSLKRFSRFFETRKEAERFRLFVEKQGAASVIFEEMPPYLGVHYQTTSERPLWGHRSNSRYSEAEVKFMRKNYLLWVPLADIARAIDRKEGSVRSRFNEAGWHFPSVRPDYRRGQLFSRDSKALFDEMYEGYVSQTHVSQLQTIGILTTESLPSLNSSGDYSLRYFPAEQLQRLRAFAIEYDRTDAASSIALLQEDFQNAFFLARQAEDMPAALAALDRLDSPPLYLARVREVTRHYLRMQFLELLPSFLEEWVELAAFRKNDFSFGLEYESERIEDSRILAGMLKACLASEPITWPPIIRAFYYAMSRTCAPSYDEAFPKELQAWVYADAYRHAMADVVDRVSETDAAEQAMLLLSCFAACIANANDILGSAPFKVDTVVESFKMALPYDEQAATLVKTARWEALTFKLKFDANA